MEKPQVTAVAKPRPSRTRGLTFFLRTATPRAASSLVSLCAATHSSLGHRFPPGGSAPQSAAGARRPHAGLCQPSGRPAAPQSLASPLPPGSALNMSKITSILCFPPPPRSHAQTRSAGPPRGESCPGQCGERRTVRRERTGRSRENAAAGPSGLGRYHGQGRPRRFQKVSRTRPVSLDSAGTPGSPLASPATRPLPGGGGGLAPGRPMCEAAAGAALPPPAISITQTEGGGRKEKKLQ